MAQINEGAIATMNENEQNDEDNSSLEEWTLLDKTSNDSIERSASTQRRGIIRSKNYVDAEIAREAIQVLEPPSLSSGTPRTNNNENNRIECFVGEDELSDGVSLISENDDKTLESQISNISNVARPVDKTVTSIGTYTCIIVTCSLAAIIGFGIGCINGKGETQLSGNKVNFGYAESTKCIQHSVQSSAKIVGPDVNIQTTKVWKMPANTSEQKPRNEPYMHIENNNDTRNVGSLQAISEKLKFSMDILCSAINHIHKSSESNKYTAVCTETFSIMKSIELEDDIQSLMLDIGYVEDGSNKWFTRNLESKLKNLSISLINDLTTSIKKSVTKIERKFNKIQHKLHQRLCLIRNTIGDDIRIHGLLSKYNVLEKSCPTEKSVHELKVESGMEYNSGNEKKYTEKYIHKHTLGKIGMDERSDVQEEYKHYRRKEKVSRNERDKLYKSNRAYKSQKENSKGDFTFDRAATGLQKDKAEKTRRRIRALPNIVESPHDMSDTGESCHTNSCSKLRINDKKNNRGSKYENWQFKRSEGRFNWREEKKVLNEIDESSWSEKRARARGSAREKNQFPNE